LERSSCACGWVRGPENRGRVCSACRVLCTDEPLRELRVAHVEAPYGLVHPALAPRIGALLGLEPDDVLRIARFEVTWLDGELVPFDLEYDDIDIDLALANSGQR